LVQVFRHLSPKLITMLYTNQAQQRKSPTKRGEIQSEDGWTRVARSNHASNINVSKQEDHRYKALPPRDPNYNQDLDEGYTRMTFAFPPAEIPAGLSLETALTIYRKYETAWCTSNAWEQLRNTLILRILNQNLPITSCICFALSSPTGLVTGGVDRRNSSMSQLAAFKSIIDLLTEMQGRRPLAFAQEPVFNTLDIALLSHLGISVVDHPKAFHLITSKTFAFCPAAEHFIVRGTLSRSPAVYMGSGALDTPPPQEASEFHPAHVSKASLDNLCERMKPLSQERMKPLSPERLKSLSPERMKPLSPERMKPLSPERRTGWSSPPKKDHQSPNKRPPRDLRAEAREKARVDAVRRAAILNRFKEDKECFKLPVFEDHQYSFHDMHMFWRSSNAPTGYG
jgi:SRR1